MSATDAPAPITNADLSSARWWRDLLARAGRQIVQVVTPIVLLAATTGDITGTDWTSIFVASVLAAAITVVRALTGLRVATGTDWTLEAADRALSAGAGSLLALITTTGFSLLDADWGDITTAVIGSVLLALAAMVTNRPQPPASTEPPVDSIPGVPAGPGRDDIDPTNDSSGLPTPDGTAPDDGGLVVDEQPLDPADYDYTTRREARADGALD